MIHILNSFSNREHHSKKFPLKWVKEHRLWTGVQRTYAPNHQCMAHTTDFFFVCLRYIGFAYSHSYLPTKPMQRRFCFLHCTGLWQTEGNCTWSIFLYHTTIVQWTPFKKRSGPHSPTEWYIQEGNMVAPTQGILQQVGKADTMSLNWQGQDRNLPRSWCLDC